MYFHVYTKVTQFRLGGFGTWAADAISTAVRLYCKSCYSGAYTTNPANLAHILQFMLICNEYTANHTNLAHDPDTYIANDAYLQ